MIHQYMIDIPLFVVAARVFRYELKSLCQFLEPFLLRRCHIWISPTRHINGSCVFLFCWRFRPLCLVAQDDVHVGYWTAQMPTCLNVGIAHAPSVGRARRGDCGLSHYSHGEVDGSWCVLPWPPNPGGLGDSQRIWHAFIKENRASLGCLFHGEH